MVLNKEDLATARTHVLGKMKQLLEDAGEQNTAAYTANITVHEDVMVHKFETDTTTMSDRIMGHLTLKMPDGSEQLVFATTTYITEGQTIEEILDSVSATFPSKEELKRQHEEALQKQQAEMAANLSPEELHKLMEGQQPTQDPSPKQ